MFCRKTTRSFFPLERLMSFLNFSKNINNEIEALRQKVDYKCNLALHLSEISSSSPSPLFFFFYLWETRCCWQFPLCRLIYMPVVTRMHKYLALLSYSLSQPACVCRLCDFTFELDSLDSQFLHKAVLSSSTKSFYLFFSVLCCSTVYTI